MTLWYNLGVEGVRAFCLPTIGRRFVRSCSLDKNQANHKATAYCVEMDEQKRCPRCGEYKDRSEFGKNSHQWDGLQSYCRPCNLVYKREVTKKWKLNNPEKNRELKNRYRRNRRGRLRQEREVARQELRTQKENQRQLDKEKRLLDKESRRIVREEKRKKRFAEFIENYVPTEESRAREREWNRLRMKARRAMQRTNGGKISTTEWKIICEHFGNVCVCCGLPEKRYKELSMDHIVPVIRGGTSDWTNIQPLCFSCNSKKHADTIDYRPPHLIPELCRKIAEFEAKKARGGTQRTSNPSRGVG